MSHQAMRLKTNLSKKNKKTRNFFSKTFLEVKLAKESSKQNQCNVLNMRQTLISLTQIFISLTFPVVFFIDCHRFTGSQTAK